MNSKEYWRKREDEALKHRIKDEKEYDKQIQRIYSDMLADCQTQINAFYGRYADKEGITLAEAKKRVKTADIKDFERKAARYVKDKDFSAKANEEMRLYNTMMKINRFEMLKANIGLEMIKGHDELEKFMSGILKGRTEEELARQAGILGKTVRNNAKLAHTIPNASFHNATFSDRIWLYQDLLKNDLERLLQTGLIQGKNPRQLARDLKAKFNTSTYNAERLMRTELARVQTEAQKQSFERNGFEEYEFIANSGCCDICKNLDGKHFKVSKMMPGENAAPMHPHCRCSAAAYSDRKEYDEWLDFLEKGGTTAEFEKMKAVKNDANRQAQIKARREAYKAKKDAENDIVEEKNTPQIVNGKDLSGQIDYSSTAKGLDIETAIHAQGFDGLPRVVSNEEFDEALKKSNFYAERTYSAPTQEVLDAYRQELYHGKWYVDCSEGGSQYGKGMYCAARYEDGKYIIPHDNKIGYEMSHYQEIGISKGNNFYYTEGMTLEPDAKIFVLPHGVKSGEYIPTQYQNHYLLTHTKGAEHEAVKRYIKASDEIDRAYQTGNYTAEVLDPLYEVKDKAQSEISKEVFDEAGKAMKYYPEGFTKYGLYKDEGTLVAEMGYDAINAEGHGEGGSYTVILNRTKVIFREGGSKYGNN